MTQGLTHDNHKIEEILRTADKHGLLWEVKEWARIYREEDPNRELLTCYRMALSEWVK